MNIKGLDYNTTREKLVLPEYGREIQKMVDYAVALPNKTDRQRCAETIIAVMDRMLPHNRANVDYKQKLWDHLAIMSGFKLDIDYPYDVSGAAKIASKPQPMSYPMNRIPVRHYGNMVFQLFEKLKTMEPGAARTELTLITAEQMKRDISQWSHGSNSDEKVVSDLARYTDGVIQLDVREMQNARFAIPAKQQNQQQKPQNNERRKGRRRSNH